MKWNRIILIVCLMWAQIVLGQDELSCEEILNEKIFSDLDNPTQKVDETMAKLKSAMIRCSDLDSIDIQILYSPPMVGAILGQMKPDLDMRYVALINKCYEITKSPGYETLKNTIINSNTLDRMLVNTKNWQKADSIMSLMHIDEEIISAVKEHSQNGIDEGETYLSILHNKVEEMTEEPELEQIEDPFFKTEKNNVFSSYDEALAKALKLNKPLLIYFTGWTCINCRRMEEEVFGNKEISSYMSENFILLMLYADDRSPLPEDEIYTSEKTGKRIDTVGKRNAELEMTKFNKNWQPFIVLVDANESIILESGYERNKDVFMEFLKKGIK